MYPDLSYLLHDLIGTPIDNWLSVFKTFGFVLAISFLVSAVVYYKELKRKALAGIFAPSFEKVIEGKPVSAAIPEIISNTLVGLIIGGKGGLIAADSTVFMRDPAAVILSTDMAWLPGIIGAAILGGLTWWDIRRQALPQPIEKTLKIWPHDRISEFTVWAAVGGILGAKIFDIFDNWQYFLRDPLGALLSGGGLAFFGGLILGFIAVVTFQYRKKIPFLHSADAVAPALTAGYGFGRIGCQLAGDGDWGIANVAPKPGWMSFLPDWMWAYRYPHTVLGDAFSEPDNAFKIGDMTAVRIEGFSGRYPFQLEIPVYPTPFYEIIMMIGVFAILWSIRKRITTPGLVFFIYLGLIAIERFAIEKIRVNEVHNVLGIILTQAEIISICLFLISIAGSIFVIRRNKRQPAVSALEEAPDVMDQD